MRAIMGLILENVDWDDLQEAKKLLIRNIWRDPDSILWKIVFVINDVQQCAIESDLWSLPDAHLEVKKSEVLPMSPQEGDLCWDPDREVGMEWRDSQWEDIPYDEWVARHKERS